MSLCSEHMVQRPRASQMLHIVLAGLISLHLASAAEVLAGQNPLWEASGSLQQNGALPGGSSGGGGSGSSASSSSELIQTSIPITLMPVFPSPSPQLQPPTCSAPAELVRSLSAQLRTTATMDLAYGGPITGYFRSLFSDCHPASPLCTESTFAGVPGVFEVRAGHGAHG